MTRDNKGHIVGIAAFAALSSRTKNSNQGVAFWRKQVLSPKSLSVSNVQFQSISHVFGLIIQDNIGNIGNWY